MTLVSRVSDLATRVAAEFKSVRTSLNGKANTSHSHFGSDLTTEVPRARLPVAGTAHTGITQHATQAEAAARSLSTKALTPNSLLGLNLFDISTMTAAGVSSDYVTPSSGTIWSSMVFGRASTTTTTGPGLTRLTGASDGAVRVSKTGLLFVILQVGFGTAEGLPGCDIKIERTSGSTTTQMASSGRMGLYNWDGVVMFGSATVTANDLISWSIRRSGGTALQVFSGATNATLILIPS